MGKGWGEGERERGLSKASQMTTMRAVVTNLSRVCFDPYVVAGKPTNTLSV